MEKDSKILIAGQTTMEGRSLKTHLESSGFHNIIPSDDNDLRSHSKVYKFFIEHKPEYIFIVDGKSGGIKANQEMPASLMIDNLKIITNLISVSHEFRVAKLLFVASSCSYPKNCIQPMQPHMLMQGPLEETNSAYATAQLAGIELCSAYKRQYGDNFISVIPANIYGPGDDFSSDNAHVISSLIQRMHKAKVQSDPTVSIWGSGSPKREFIYLEDFSKALKFIMTNYNEVLPLNVGSNEVVSIKELSILIKKVVGFTGDLVFDTTKPDGMKEKSLDSSVLKRMGFASSCELEEGIKNTYDWYIGAER